MGAVLAPAWKSTWFSVLYCRKWGAAGTETWSVAAGTQGVSVSLGEYHAGGGLQSCDAGEESDTQTRFVFPLRHFFLLP